MSEAAFQLSLPFFEGPVDELVRELQRQKMDVVQLPLAVIAGQYAEYMRQEENLDLGDAGQFLLTTARLLYLKSSYLLAEPVVPDEVVPDQRITWRERRRYQAVAEQLAKWEGRESFPSGPRGIDVPQLVEPFSVASLVRAWQEMLSRTPRAAIRVVVPVYMTLEDAVARLIGLIAEDRTVRFSRLRRRANRRDTVVQFLAVLELARRNKVVARQSVPFGDITVEPSRLGVDSESRAG